MKIVKLLVTQSCLTLCDPMDCSPPGSSVHEILQAGILEWVVIPSSRGSPWRRDQTRLLHCRQTLYHLNYQEAHFNLCLQHTLFKILPSLCPKR